MKSNNFRYRIFFVALVSLCLLQCDSANDFDEPYQDYFVKYFGGDGDQSGIDMVLAPDGSIAIVGKSKVGSDTQIYFLRVDQFGNVLAENIFGDTDRSEDVKDIELTNDGNFIVVADILTSANNKDVSITKVSPAGTVLSESVDGTLGNEVVSSVTSLSDGGYITCGTTDSTSTWGNEGDPNADRGDFFVYRYHSDLEMLHENEWSFQAGFSGDDGFDAATKVFQSGSSFICLGYSTNNLFNGNPLRNSVFMYFKISGDGGVAAANVPGDQNDPVNKSNTTVLSSSIAANSDPGFLITGVSNTTTSQELFISKLRPSLDYSNDDEIYMKISIEGSQRLSGVSAISSTYSPEGYLILANDLRASGANNIWISKMDRSKNIRWSASFGSEEGDDLAGSVIELANGRILVLGTMKLADNQTKLALIKLNSQGQLLK